MTHAMTHVGACARQVKEVHVDVLYGQGLLQPVSEPFLAFEFDWARPPPAAGRSVQVEVRERRASWSDHLCTTVCVRGRAGVRALLRSTCAQISAAAVAGALRRLVAPPPPPSVHASAGAAQTQQHMYSTGCSLVCGPVSLPARRRGVHVAGWRALCVVVCVWACWH
jgi:hypothetical protein